MAVSLVASTRRLRMAATPLQLQRPIQNHDQGSQAPVTTPATTYRRYTPAVPPRLLYLFLFAFSQSLVPWLARPPASQSEYERVQVLSTISYISGQENQTILME